MPTRQFDALMRCSPGSVGKLFLTTRLGGYWKRSSTAEHLALSTCSTYEYLTPDEACAYAFQHSNRFQHAMAASSGTQLSPEPKDWRDIKGRPDADKWLQAAHEEIMGLLENGTFTLERVPEGGAWYSG